MNTINEASKKLAIILAEEEKIGFVPKICPITGYEELRNSRRGDLVVFHRNGRATHAVSVSAMDAIKHAPHDFDLQYALMKRIEETSGSDRTQIPLVTSDDRILWLEWN